MNIWVSRLYDASKAKMLKKSSYNLNFPWKYLISELTSLKSLSEYFKNSSGPNFGRMQMKQSDPVPVKWQFCWHSGLESSNSHYVMQCHLEPWHTNQFKLGCTEQFQWQKLYSCLCLQISFQCSSFFFKTTMFLHNRGRTQNEYSGPDGERTWTPKRVQVKLWSELTFHTFTDDSICCTVHALHSE